MGCLKNIPYFQTTQFINYKEIENRFNFQKNTYPKSTKKNIGLFSGFTGLY